MNKPQPNTTTAPTGQIAPFGLRMLPELRARIEEQARNAGRSMNAEIVARLMESLDRPATSDLDVFTIAEEVRKGLPANLRKAGFNIELKVTRIDDPSEGPYRPTHEEYEQAMAPIRAKTKKKDALTLDAESKEVYSVTGIRMPPDPE